MANRFGKKKHTSFLAKISLPLIAFVVLFVLFFRGVSSVSEQTTERQLTSLKTAITRDINHCYAVEGTYPPSVDYLIEHYGLTYDKEQFMVDYIFEGSNIYPNVTVLQK